MSQKFDVVAVGTLNIDFMARGEAPRDIETLNKWAGPAEISIKPAGSLGYCAVDMARLGLKVGVVSIVASDLFGNFIIDDLKSQGIDTSAIRIAPDSITGIGLYLLLFGNNKRPIAIRLGSHAPWPSDIDSKMEENLKSAKMLHCSGYLHYPQMWGEPTVQLFRYAKKIGLRTSLDTQYPIDKIEGTWMKCFENLLEFVDILFTDETEATSIAGVDSAEKAATELLKQGPKIVVVKQGEKGAIVATKEKLHRQPIYKIDNIVDPIGAGDAFDAGFIFGQLSAWSLEKSAKFASITAAMTLRGAGGTQTAPTLEEVEKLL